MLWRTCVGAGHDVLEIALGLNPDWQSDKKRHEPDNSEQHEARYNTHALDLFQLNQSAVEILGVQEQHGLAMRANFWLSGAQNPRAC